MSEDREALHEKLTRFWDEVFVDTLLREGPYPLPGRGLLDIIEERPLLERPKPPRTRTAIMAAMTSRAFDLVGTSSGTTRPRRT